MATHSIAFSSSLLSDARRPASTQYTHSAPFNPVSVRPKPLIVPPYECGACLRTDSVTVISEIEEMDFDSPPMETD